ncbi:hypothetical protein L917_02762 [Phytophthora nicotianae]|uniref:Uncharacterized protein n=4 Tax=Phytophthora nicotianae TaxID=4792 RepID=W2PKE9_PHYN3|nr:hypothetical protein PPTG_17218 [Phytophthora nicotianae INRA-310]ETI54153.1 hypothetical protein F443_02991 [Phytophthora nicotianae P1569]ETM00522.1 hypothetical protein L917_02762 [Phytophthora nicotianae]ETO82909.1 hypothetical protein F444_03004 [Phytophthora nicotianae P1976]ETM53726.1 hypothetical protein L914_02823 [Phytophthora nicotianae]ETN01488.1 hypothetical protein PPTG_17218 [Phytophthora nicotianae INRA-310]
MSNFETTTRNVSVLRARAIYNTNRERGLRSNSIEKGTEKVNPADEERAIAVTSITERAKAVITKMKTKLKAFMKSDWLVDLVNGLDPIF